MMTTLYELLGALPHDDAEGLRAAFRRAVKGAHPDMRPGDPNAALKFRKIVRANEILSDTEQRAYYDHLLLLARLERKAASERAVAASIHKIASAVIALSGGSFVAVGGYLLFMHMSAIASVINFDTTGASAMKSEVASLSGEPVARSTAAAAQTTEEDGSASDSGAASDLAASESRSPPSQGDLTCGPGDPHGRTADLAGAPGSDPKSLPLPAYVDTGTIFYRIGKSDRVFPDFTPIPHLGKTAHLKPVPATVRRSQIDPAAPPVSRRSIVQSGSQHDERIVEIARRAEPEGPSAFDRNPAN